jgi:hypothetical protein
MLSLRELEPAVWSELQFGGCQLGDKRRTERLVTYARQMAEKPDASTPCQTENWADCKAAYNMFKQAQVTFDSVTAVHYQRTKALKKGTYLVLSDLTELDYGYNSQRQGLGRLTSDKHRGFFLQSALVVGVDDGEVIGLGAQELFTRSLQKQKRVHRVDGRKRLSEAEVWGRVIDRVGPSHDDVYLIHVGDRGADNFDVFAHIVYQQSGWVIRAAQLTRKVRQSDGTIVKLRDLLKRSPVVGSYQVYIGANQKQKARWATVDVRVAQATLLRPREGSTAFVMDNDIREIETNVVEVREADPPTGCAPVRWVLYTSEPATTFIQAQKVIEHYERRPIVEEYHKCLKTGLQVERRQYKSSDRLEAVIGVTCVQAVRLLQLRDVSRQAPETPARKVVPPQWLEVLSRVLKRPRPIETVRDFMRALASLGGFLGRKCDGEPGWMTIWRGLKTLIVALRGYRAGLKKCG